MARVKSDQDEAHLQRCLEIMDFTEDELDAFFNLPPLHTDAGEDVPAIYVRERLTSMGLHPEIEPDYFIDVFEGSNEERKEGYPMHEIVWTFQCTMVFPILEGSTTRLCHLERPWAEAIKPFIAWLYTNDEQQLYDDLVAGLAVSETFCTSFCSLVRAAGCINQKIPGVMRAVYSSE